MSSHIFEEVEKTCGRVVIIKEGEVAMQGNIQTLEQSQHKSFLVQLANPQDAFRLKGIEGRVVRLSDHRYEVSLRNDQIGSLLGLLAQLEVVSLESKRQSLEDIFLHLYGREASDESDVI